MKKTLLLIVSLFIVIILIKSFFISFTDKNDFKDIQFEILEDTEYLSFYDIRNHKYLDFKKYTNEFIENGKTYWIKFRLKKDNNSSKEYYIHYHNFLSEISLYQYVNNKINIENGGLALAESNRTRAGFLKDKVQFYVNTKNTVFYLKIKNNFYNKRHFNSFSVLSKKKYSSLQFKKNILIGIFIGMLLIVLCINLVTYIVSKKLPFLYYTIYLVLTAMFFMFYYQINEFLWFYNAPLLDMYMMNAVMFIQVFIPGFIYLLLKEFQIQYERKVLKIYFISTLIIVVVASIIELFNIYISFQIDALFSLVSGFSVLYFFFKLYHKVPMTIKYILIGIFAVTLGGILSYVDYFINITIFSSFYYQMGVVIEFVFFTIAINLIYKSELDVILQSNYSLAKEKKEIQNKNKKLVNEIDTTNRELTVRNLELYQKSSIINKTLCEAQKILHNETKSTINTIVNNLKTNNTVANWNEFELYFNKTHPSFYAKLNKKYKDLTPNERKICAFIKLNFSTKEIASITGKQLNSIDVARSRLRKKMKLKQTENLNTILSKF